MEGGREFRKGNEDAEGTKVRQMGCRSSGEGAGVGEQWAELARRRYRGEGCACGLPNMVFSRNKRGRDTGGGNAGRDSAGEDTGVGGSVGSHSPGGVFLAEARNWPTEGGAIPPSRCRRARLHPPNRPPNRPVSRLPDQPPSRAPPALPHGALPAPRGTPVWQPPALEEPSAPAQHHGDFEEGIRGLGSHFQVAWPPCRRRRRLRSACGPRIWQGRCRL
jgi:hypothetical protein